MSKPKTEDVILDVPTTYRGEGPHPVGERISVAPHDADWLVTGGRAHRPRKTSTTSTSEVTDDE